MSAASGLLADDARDHNARYIDPARLQERQGGRGREVRHGMVRENQVPGARPSADLMASAVSTRSDVGT